MSLTSSATKGVSWTASSIFIRTCLQIIQLLVIARFLTPFELGLLAMINLTIGFAQIFGDAGLSNAIIYYKGLTKSQLNQLYWVNIGLGFVISAAVFILALPIEIYFTMESLAELLCYVAPVFFIRSLGQQSMALLQQRLQFNLLAKAEVISASLGFIATMVSLYCDLTTESIIIGQWVSALILSSLVCLYAQQRLPRLEKIQWCEVKAPVQYGLYQSGEACVNYFGGQFDRLIIGKVLGAEVLGVYAYMKELATRPAYQLINPIVHRVAFPLMVKHKENGKLSTMYASTLLMLSFCNIPLYGVLSLYPEFILNLLFGSEWVQYADILRWLAIYVLIMSFINPIGSLLRATGAVKRAFWWNVAISLLRPILILVLIPFGIVTVVQGLALLQGVIFILHWCVLIKPTIPLQFMVFIRACLLPALIFVVVYAVMKIILAFFGSSPSIWLELILGASMYGGVTAFIAKNYLIPSFQRKGDV